MKVLHITNLYPFDEHPTYGIFIKEQIDSLTDVGIQNDVIFINALQKGKMEYLKTIPMIRKLAKSFDIVHCHHSFCGFSTTQLAGISKPVVTSFLNIVGGESKSPFIEKLINKRVIDGSAAFIVKHDPTISKTYPSKGNYVPNGVDTEKFFPVSEVEACKKLDLPVKDYALFVSSGSRDRPQKRYDIFRQVVDILNSQYHHNLEELLLIKTERHLVPYYFNASKLHLLTSGFEGSPNSVKESLACNRPVVSTDVGNVKHMIGDISGCKVSSSLDPQEIAELAHQALMYQGEFQGRSALAAKKLDMASVAGTIKSIYTNLLQ